MHSAKDSGPAACPAGLNVQMVATQTDFPTCDCHSIRGYCTSERNRHDCHAKPCADQLLRDGKSEIVQKKTLVEQTS